jgi:hypothetical protein
MAWSVDAACGTLPKTAANNKTHAKNNIRVRRLCGTSCVNVETAFLNSRFCVPYFALGVLIIAGCGAIVKE